MPIKSNDRLLKAADKIARSVGRKVAEIRVRTGMTQKELADKLGVDTAGYVRRIEQHGGSGNISILTLIKLADALGVDFMELLKKPSPEARKRGPGRPPKRR